MIGNTTDTRFKHMAIEKILRNCPVRVKDITNALFFFVTDLEVVQGKTVGTKPDRVEMDVVQIPMDFYKLNKYVTLMVDVMFVNGVDFLTTLSRSIRLFTAEHVPYRTTAQLSNFSKKKESSSITKEDFLYG